MLHVSEKLVVIVSGWASREVSQHGNVPVKKLKNLAYTQLPYL